MKKILISFIFILLNLIIFSQEKRTALIIGNSNYKEGFLKNPVNDAKLMSSTLKSLGFDVTTKLDIPDQNEMKKIIREFGAIIKSKGGVALFYYAGHGIQIQGINYLIPIKASINKEEDVEYECVQVDMIFSELQYAESKTNIVILDACRNNPFTRSFKRSGADRGLAVISKSPSGTIIAFATAPGNIAIDGYGNNGLYTEELVKCMTMPNVDISKIFMQVRNNVAKRSNNQQIPWENSSLFNEFYFVKQESGGKQITIEEKPLYGSIEIEVLENGKLYIDNKFIGDVTSGKKITLNNITVGWHDIELKYDDKSEIKNVFVDKNKIVIIAFTYNKQERSEMPDSFVFVKGGTFQMGDTFGDGDTDERPTHTVTVNSFWISKYEVTQKEWVEVMGNNLIYFENDNLPVQQINWYDCIEYCNKRSINEELQLYYNIDKSRKDQNNLNKNDNIKWIVTINEGANGYRLPTEAEWEFAAKGGIKSKGYKYSGSNNVDDVVIYYPNSSKFPHLVGSKKPNELGLYDMSGNVWEWCWDWYDRYPGNNDKKDTYGTKCRVSRGGAWDGGYWNDRVSHRFGYYSPSDRSSYMGFRIVRTF